MTIIHNFDWIVPVVNSAWRKKNCSGNIRNDVNTIWAWLTVPFAVCLYSQTQRFDRIRRISSYIDAFTWQKFGQPNVPFTSLTTKPLCLTFSQSRLHLCLARALSPLSPSRRPNIVQSKYAPSFLFTDSNYTPYNTLHYSVERIVFLCCQINVLMLRNGTCMMSSLRMQQGVLLVRIEISITHNNFVPFSRR